MTLDNLEQNVWGELERIIHCWKNAIISKSLSYTKIYIEAYSFMTKLRKTLCLIVWGFAPLENVSLIWRRRHYRWSTTNVNLCPALMVIEQLGILNVPHLLWHGRTLYNGHLQEPVTPKSGVERLTVELSLPVGIWPLFSNTRLRKYPVLPDSLLYAYCRWIMNDKQCIQKVEKWQLVQLIIFSQGCFGIFKMSGIVKNLATYMYYYSVTLH